MRQIEEIAAEILKAKGEQIRIKKTLNELEAEIAEQLESPENGSKTHALNGYKITVKRGILTSADVAGLESCGAKLKPLETKQVFSAKGLEWIKENSPHDYELCVPYITTKPAKTAVKVVKEAE